MFGLIPTGLQKVSADTIEKNPPLSLEYYRTLKNSGQITAYDYDNIKLIIESLTPTATITRSTSNYYPERYISRMNYAGVKYLYEKGIAQARFAEALFSTAFSAIPYVG